jgi:hypothetical protein
MLHAIGGIEDAGHYAAARSFERAEKHGLAFLQDKVRLAEKAVL